MVSLAPLVVIADYPPTINHIGEPVFIGMAGRRHRRRNLPDDDFDKTLPINIPGAQEFNRFYMAYDTISTKAVKNGGKRLAAKLKWSRCRRVGGWIG